MEQNKTRRSIPRTVKSSHKRDQERKDMTAEQLAKRLQRTDLQDTAHTADYWREKSLKEIYETYCPHPSKRWYALSMIQYISKLRYSNY